MRFITYIFGCILLLSGISLKAQERNLFKKKTEIEVKSNSQLFQEKNKKKDELDELPPLQFRNETESVGVTAGSELQERKFEPIKMVNASISNFDTTSIDEGENLIVEIEEEAAPEGTEDFVSVASYYAIWDTKIIDPYDIDAKEFDEPVDIELYNTAAGRNWAAPLEIVILAAGQGKRMASDLPKVLHHVAAAPLLHHALSTAQALEPSRIVTVTGHGGEAVAASATAFNEAVDG